MRVEIEAAALFITRLVNKNLSQASSISPGSSASSTHSSSSSYSSSDSPPAPGYECSQQDHHLQEPPLGTGTGLGMGTVAGTGTNQPIDQCVEDKVEQFRQCLMKALHDRFHNHWFPDKPSKGQAYRCIRLNGFDRHDETLQQACEQCGIEYKDLQLPVELTLWVDPDEVTCRFGENKGSHCLVAKFKDGELQDNNLDPDDIHNINIEFFPQQTTTEKMRQLTINEAHDDVDYNNRKHQNHHQQHQLNNMSINNNHHNTSISSVKSNNSPKLLYHHNNSQQLHHHQQTHNINNHHHHQPHNQYHHNNNHLQNHHHHHQQQQPQHQHQKTAILPNYHNNYLNDNPIYYYF